MPRFQSNFFNWLDHSLPVKWGRQARRWLAIQQSRSRSSSNQQQPEVVEFFTAVIAVLGQKLKPNLQLRGQHRDPTSNKPSTKQVKANPVGDFGSDQPKLPTQQPPKLLTGITAAIAALVKRVKSWLVSSRSNDSESEVNELVNELDHEPKWVAAPEPDYWSNYWSKTPATASKQIPHFSALKLKQDQLATNHSWWEEMQQLLRSAIAYFLAKDARSKKLPGVESPNLEQNLAQSQASQSLPPDHGQNAAIAQTTPKSLDHWLDDWRDYNPAQVVKLEHKLPSSGTLDPSHSPGTINTQTNLTTDLTTDLSPSPSAKITASETTSHLETQTQTRETPLHAWIETRSEFLGYAYDPIMAVVHWCDRWVAALEKFCQRLWQALVHYWRLLLQNLH